MLTETQNKERVCVFCLLHCSQVTATTPGEVETTRNWQHPNCQWTVSGKTLYGGNLTTLNFVSCDSAIPPPGFTQKKQYGRLTKMCVTACIVYNIYFN